MSDKKEKKGLFLLLEEIKEKIDDSYPNPYKGLSDQERAYQLGYREGQKTAYHLIIDSSLELLADVKDIS